MPHGVFYNGNGVQNLGNFILKKKKYSVYLVK